MTKQIEALRQWVAESESIVFFGGAGVSTESGIPDFRSVDGLYHQKFQYPPETILSHSFYVRRKAEFYDFYRAFLPLYRRHREYFYDWCDIASLYGLSLIHI